MVRTLWQTEPASNFTVKCGYQGAIRASRQLHLKTSLIARGVSREPGGPRHKDTKIVWFPSAMLDVHTNK